ncbi:uncharacterized protein LOC141919022 [Strix aluco]|uniref:uncharacterized protein LOC141919022 n=1 Tax=Strix aluco TaxID=111821 RepID=UPI003DA25904
MNPDAWVPPEAGDAEISAGETAAAPRGAGHPLSPLPPASAGATPSRRLSQPPLGRLKSEWGARVRASAGAGPRGGGTAARPGEWPWQVSLQLRGEHFCGGTPQSPRNGCCRPPTASRGPTGAGRKPTAWRAVVGRLRLQETGGQERTVVEVVVHEGYRRVEGGHDLALARLESPVTLGPRVGTICLPQAQHPFAFGTPCWITGWGHVAENVSLPAGSPLQKVALDLLSPETCNCLYSNLRRRELARPARPTMVCAGGQEGGRGACQADSGGPLACGGPGGQWVQAGVLSFAVGCARPNGPVLATGLVAHAGWLLGPTPAPHCLRPPGAPPLPLAWRTASAWLRDAGGASPGAPPRPLLALGRQPAAGGAAPLRGGAGGRELGADGRALLHRVSGGPPTAPVDPQTPPPAPNTPPGPPNTPLCPTAPPPGPPSPSPCAPQHPPGPPDTPPVPHSTPWDPQIPPLCPTAPPGTPIFPPPSPTAPPVPPISPPVPTQHPPGPSSPPPVPHSTPRPIPGGGLFPIPAGSAGGGSLGAACPRTQACGHRQQDPRGLGGGGNRGTRGVGAPACTCTGPTWSRGAAGTWRCCSWSPPWPWARGCGPSACPTASTSGPTGTRCWALLAPNGSSIPEELLSVEVTPSESCGTRGDIRGDVGSHPPATASASPSLRAPAPCQPDGGPP